MYVLMSQNATTMNGMPMPSRKASTHLRPFHIAYVRRIRMTGYFQLCVYPGACKRVAYALRR